VNRAKVLRDLDVNDGRRVTRERGSGAAVEIELIVAETASGDDERDSKIVCDLDATDCGSVGRLKQLAMSAEIDRAVMGLVRRRRIGFMAILE
jgi:hypothetical protein